MPAGQRPEPAPAAGEQRQQQQGGGLMGIIQSLGRMVVMYYLFSYFASSLRGGNQSGNMTPESAKVSAKIDSKSFVPLWNYGVSTDLHVYLSEHEYLRTFDHLLWQEKGLVYGNWDERHKAVQIDVPESVQHNGTLYAHMFLTPAGLSPNPADERHEKDPLYHRKLLTRYMPKKKAKRVKNLVAGKSDVEKPEPDMDEEPEGETPIISYWWPNMTISTVNVQDPIPTAMPPAVVKNIRLADDRLHYYPIFYVNEFWMLQDQLIPINDTVKTLNLSLSYTPIAWWKYQMYAQFDESFKLQQNMMGVASSETDEMKRMFLETNPILLAVTFVVSLLHSAFDFLAFKNDIQFWRQRKDMEGLSFRAIVMNVVFQTIIFLYLLDNETSWMVLFSSGAGLIIEAWKINKTAMVKRKDQFPYIQFIDRVKPSKLVSETREYDEMAFKYVSYAMYPCLAAYAVYSLMYQEHKSWYSYIVGTLVGFVYAFGFISMTPQLFINYKMKSVAHMPWKTFMYKALNTFVDDLFAFVIKMPWLHRLACLRDDVVFLIYLYQRWIYPEDKRRRNEFGQVGEEDGDKDESDVKEERKALDDTSKGSSETRSPNVTVNEEQRTIDEHLALSYVYEKEFRRLIGDLVEIKLSNRGLGEIIESNDKSKSESNMKRRKAKAGTSD